MFLFFFSFVLPTPTRLWCLYPCYRHHLPLTCGSFALVRPSLVALRALPSLFFFCFFSLFFVCTTLKPPPSSRCRRPCGDLVLSGLVLAVPGAAHHPPWWFPFGHAIFYVRQLGFSNPVASSRVGPGCPDQVPTPKKKKTKQKTQKKTIIVVYTAILIHALFFWFWA